MADLPTTYNNDRAYSNSWIVYINGLQVPVAGVTVAHGVWQIPQAQLEMLPDPVIHRLGAEDRVQVQVFYCDQWYRTRPEFCLAFDGEIVAWGFVGTTGGRAVSFTCIDYIQILTQLFFFFMSSFDDIAVGVSGQQLGVGATTVETAGYGPLYPYTLFSQGLADLGPTSDSNATISRPIDFAYNIVRALIKAQHPNRTIPSANFFAPWCKRTNFHRRWIALPYIDMDPGGNPNVGVFPVLRAVQADQALAAVARLAATNGSSGSMWDMLRDVLMTMMMEVGMNPAPQIVRSDYSSLLPKGPVNGQTGPLFLANYCVKPQFLFGLPPTCNVFFPPQMGAYAYQENYITQATRMYFNEEAILSVLNANGNNIGAGAQALMQDALTTGYPEEVDAAARAAAEGRSTNGKNLLVFSEEFYKGPVIERKSMPRWFMYLLAATQTGNSPSTPVPETDTGTDGGDNNIGDPGAQYQVRDITNEDELFGATDAVLNVRDAKFQQAFGSLQLPAWGQVVQGDLRNTLRTVRTKRLGACVPPQTFPVIPAPAVTISGDGAAGSFFASRRNRNTGSPRLHAGIDLDGPRGLSVVSTTAGVAYRVVPYNGTPATASTPARPNNDAQGNAVYIRDAQGGQHRYMHLESIAITQGASVAVGTVIGTMGNSGDGRLRAGNFGVHLHYDVTTSGGYRLNYTERLRDLKAGRQATTPRTVTSSTTAPPAPTTSPTSQGQVQEPARADTSSGDTNRNLFKLYACYEYFKSRYSMRQGTVTTGFNPYPVAGYPCMVFDRRSTQCDTAGYLMSVRHTMYPNNFTTDIAFSHGRTLQEMFSLMQRISAGESGRLGVQQATISQAIQSRSNPPGGNNFREGDAGLSTNQPDGTSDDILAGIGLPIGALAMAPPEPILEIQGVIQTFERADEFYKAIFHQGRAVGADVLSATQAAADNLRGDGDLYVSYLSATEIAEARARGETNEQLAARAQNAVAEDTQPEPRQTTTAAARPARRGVFYYPEIIDLIPYDGDRTPIQIEGTDGITRARILRIITDVRNGVASEEDLEFLRAATEQGAASTSPGASEFQSTTADGARTIIQPVAGQPLDEATRNYLDGIELTQRTRAAVTNVRGDVTIVPRPGAASLFTSGTAAMQFVGRPICTLDEYIEFLGEDGLREGRVAPSVSSAQRSPQIHPAHFYTRIRRFRPGPPTTRAVSNTTNADTATDGATGATTPGGTSTATTSAPGVPTTLQDLVALFGPEFDAAVGQATLELFQNGAQGSITATDLPTLEEQFAQAAANAAISPETYVRLRTAIMNASQTLGGMEQPRGTTGAAPTNTPTITEAAGRPGSYPVDGIPLGFPDTRANWDAVLERYRSNALSKLPPNA